MAMETEAEAVPEQEQKPAEIGVGAVTEGPKAEFQQYTSALVATCLFTPTGKRINFANYEYYTKDSEIIEYMDAQLKIGLRGFKKGEIVLAEDINPMAALKRKHIEEFLASQVGRDFTAANADPAKVAAKAAILSSTGVTTHGT